MLKMEVTGEYDHQLEVRVRGAQAIRNLEINGRVDPQTAAALGEPATHGLVPLWYHRPLSRGDHGHDVEIVQIKTGWEPNGFYDYLTEQSVLRFQSAHQLPLTGVVDEPTAAEMGDT